MLCLTSTVWSRRLVCEDVVSLLCLSMVQISGTAADLLVSGGVSLQIGGVSLLSVAM